MGGLDTERARAYLASLPPESRPTAKRESPQFTGRVAQPSTFVTGGIAFSVADHEVPNILVEAADPAPFVEDRWVGCGLRVGGVRLRVDKRDGRCAVITIDPLDQ
jgi:hypothetical protein